VKIKRFSRVFSCLFWAIFQFLFSLFTAYQILRSESNFTLYFSSFLFPADAFG